MGEWAVGQYSPLQWIVSAISFQKIYGLYSSEHQKVEKWFVGGFCGYGGSVWVMGKWAVSLLDSGCHQLSENIWFV